MSDLFAYLFFLLLLIFGFSMGVGVNIKKWYGWAQVLSGFLLGLLMGQNLSEKMILGVFITIMTIWLGPIVWKRRNP